jgi:hypothetical protein
MGSNSPLTSETQHIEYLIEIRSELMEIRFEIRSFNSYIMLNYYLFQKLKLIGNGKFNHLINIITFCRWKILCHGTCRHTRLTFPPFTLRDQTVQIQSISLSSKLMKAGIPS